MSRTLYHREYYRLNRALTGQRWAHVPTAPAKPQGNVGRPPKVSREAYEAILMRAGSGEPLRVLAADYDMSISGVSKLLLRGIKRYDREARAHT